MKHDDKKLEQICKDLESTGVSARFANVCKRYAEYMLFQFEEAIIDKDRRIAELEIENVRVHALSLPAKESWKSISTPSGLVVTKENI